MNACIKCGTSISYGTHCPAHGRHCLRCGTVNDPFNSSCRICGHKGFTVIGGLKPQTFNIKEVRFQINTESKAPEGVSQTMRFVFSGREVWLMLDGFAFERLTAEEWEKLEVMGRTRQ